MLSMKIDVLVSAMVRKLLIEPGGRNNEALHIHLDCSMSQHYNVGSNAYNSRCGLHLLYWLPVDRTYVSVFSAVTDSPFTKVKDVEKWVHEATHDTCWRDIRTFSNVYFDMAKKINSAIEADGFKPCAPADMQENNCFALFGPMFDWLPVKVIKDEDDLHGYRRLVELL